jgi:hypothetical protein
MNQITKLGLELLTQFAQKYCGHDYSGLSVIPN